MATTSYSKETYGAAELTLWPAVPNGNDGQPAISNSFGDRTVQVAGTFGAGGTVVIEGSNDGSNYHTLTDPQGNALSFTAAGLETIMETPRYTRPRVTAGDGTTALNVYIHARKTIR